jgi:hypothetical protein
MVNSDSAKPPNRGRRGAGVPARPLGDQRIITEQGEAESNTVFALLIAPALHLWVAICLRAFGYLQVCFRAEVAAMVGGTGPQPGEGGCAAHSCRSPKLR